MKVIGAGLPRTATLAQRVFLEESGVGQCYHMTRVWEDLRQVQYWVDAFEGRPDWTAVLGEFEASVDWPGAFYWRELMIAYPDAKVILSVRDAESWAASIQSTIWDALFGDTIMRDLSRARAKVVPEWGRFRDLMTAMWRRSGLLESSEKVFDERAVGKGDGGIQRRGSTNRASGTPARLVTPGRVGEDLRVPGTPFPGAHDTARQHRGHVHAANVQGGIGQPESMV